MDFVFQVLAVFAMSMVKFAFSQLMAVGMGFGFLSTLIITVAGGCAGVLVFFFGSGWLMEFANRRRSARIASGKPAKRAFTRTNRTIVRVKRDRGLSGLAFFMPVLISIPVGAVLAAKYFRNDPRTLPALLVSVLVWGMVLTGFWHIVG